MGQQQHIRRRLCHLRHQRLQIRPRILQVAQQQARPVAGQIGMPCRKGQIRRMAGQGQQQRQKQAQAACNCACA
jgi:hypothetical protein